MIHGAHVIIYSKDAEADRAFFRDVLKYESADAGYGWLIFALPPAEVAVHPSETNDVHELNLMCDDVQAFIAEMQKKKVKCAPIEEQRWGSITRLTLPGGGKLGVYQPKHASPLKTRPTSETVRRMVVQSSAPAMSGARRSAGPPNVRVLPRRMRSA